MREALYADGAVPLRQARAKLLRTLIDDAAADASEPVFLCGHFRYRHYPFAELGVPVITFLRDPLERVVSWYRFAHRARGEKRTLEEFVEDERAANVQSAFLAGIELPDLAFVGIAERYEESVELFNRQTGFEVPVLDRNRGSRLSRLVRLGRSATRREARRLDPATRELILARNRRDVELHRTGRDLVERRLETLRSPAALGHRVPPLS